MGLLQARRLIESLTGGSVIGTDAQCLVELVDGGIDLAEASEGNTKVEVGIGVVGTKADGRGELACGVGYAVLLRKRQREVVMRVSIAGLEANRFGKFGCGLISAAERA